ncbi:MAG: HEAT repeat domain-containing protein [Paludisphaera borealis]|uniref:HEAT repeat domain-containing protein n=1 Tax=Paludisphaera borealis TaxID=1387353 RepID=UPI002842D9EA|nr:HEAT repeat domain-containing protein [Paludisphaera borealis]MDR3619336.1 HEAT repeat domain-containing protein [Paludisphaera borealis]
MRENIVRSMAGILALVVVASTPPGSWGQVPGPESFAKEPETPVELWGAIDYLVRTGQSKQAMPYLEKFTKSNPDDATLITIRDKYGPGSFLRLSDYPETKSYAHPLVEKLTTASRKVAADPQRVRRFVEALGLSGAEQDYAVSRLRESGAHAVPPLVEEIAKQGYSTPERSRLVHNAGRLDRSSVPAWIAALDSPDPHLAANAATILGAIGDPRAVPFLTYPAAAADSSPALKTAAQRAIASLTGKPFESQPTPPTQVLVDAAVAFARHRFEMPSDTVLVWKWDDAQSAPAPSKAVVTEVEEYFGIKLARQALKLDPTNRKAQTVLLGLSLEKAVERVGFVNFPAKDQATFATALAAGPAVLADILRAAIADGKSDLAAVTADALGKVTDAKRLAADGRPHPLVDALSRPGRRLQLAAAKALVDMAPSDPFPGSSRVVPALGRFVMNQSQPRAVVIDGNPTRGSATAGLLKQLGYDASLQLTGEQGFQDATESADVELILVSHHLTQGRWNLLDVLTNLRNDSRTSNLPLYIYGPQSLEITRPNLPVDYPGVKYMVYTTDRGSLERQLGGRPAKLSDAERLNYAKQAAALLARIASQPNSPFAPDLAAAEPALTAAIGTPDVALSASTALGDVPNAEAQRALADVVLDPSRDAELRRSSAQQLARSIQRFGPLVAADQEVKLVDAFRGDEDPELHAALGMVVGTLRRDPRPGVKAKADAN